MLKFRRLDIIVAEAGYAPDRTAKVLVSWELVTQHSRLDQTTFSIERSQSPKFAEDEFEVIAEGIEASPGQFVYVYQDVTPNLLNFWRRYFYRIRAHTPEGEILSETNTWETNPRPHELAIIERHDQILQFTQGQPSFAFIERTADAAYCVCYDVTAGRVTDAKCTLCFGTGRQRPFFDPIPFYADFNPSNKVTQITSFGEMQPHQKDCWFSAYPLLKPGDLIYQVVTGLLFRIAKLHPVQPQGTTIQQVARLNALERSEVEYRGLVQRISDELLEETVQEWERVKEERMF